MQSASISFPDRSGSATHEPVRFVAREERERFVATFDGLVVRVSATAPTRARLAEAIDDAFERTLTERGAPAPGIAQGADAALSDRMFRARRIGASAVCIVVEGLASQGSVESDDAAALVMLAAAARSRPITIVLDAEDGTLEAFARTIPVGRLLAPVPAAAPAPAPAPALKHTAGASIAKTDDSWRQWVLALSAAKGPQSLAVFERLFRESYVPLANAIAAGLDDPRARLAYEDFRRAFEKSYGDACPTFAVTGKRPKMVLDAPEIAARTARLHGARTMQLLLVDSMRWDLGQAVKAKVASLLATRAAMCDEMTLWSALPSTTSRQLATLARGLEALRSPAERELDVESLRGRTADFVRRTKIGARDVYKLDLVEARVREAGSSVAAAIPTIAEAAAHAIARHAEQLAPRTLLFVFGDHGFTIERSADAPTRQGGASPEEVLVPAWGMLVADVH